jgi:hypothetical protein
MAIAGCAGYLDGSRSVAEQDWPVPIAGRAETVIRVILGWALVADSVSFVYTDKVDPELVRVCGLNLRNIPIHGYAVLQQVVVHPVTEIVGACRGCARWMGKQLAA